MGAPPIKIDFDKIYNSNSYGKFKIIEDLGRDDKSRLYVKIKFLETGTEKDIRYDLAMDGKVRDELYGIDFNKIFMSNYYGPYKIISHLGIVNKDSHRFVRIKFLNTGYEYDVPLRIAQSGFVRDPTLSYDQKTAPLLNKEEYDKRIINILEQRWKAMIDRCYNKNSKSFYKYGALGVTVCDFWKDKNNFISSVQNIRRYQFFYNNPQFYFIDKDYLQIGIPKEYRIYSPETCIFLSMEDNSNLASLENANPNEWFGVKQLASGLYRSSLRIKGSFYSIGNYTSIVAAINEYNTYYLTFCKYELVPLINVNIQFMDHYRAQEFYVPNTRCKEILEMEKSIQI